LNVSISLELVALVLVLLVVSFAKANAAAPVSTTPNMNCVIMSITLQVHLWAVRVADRRPKFCRRGFTACVGREHWVRHE
jgi:hypothetical protein